ncbi:Na+/H+ antiporter NhaC family protein [Alkaliphilus serpentinus]|uniref:Na+/H+ antiporter NhaC-like C-terminal domain-containing protein n=1 Tax=Alkaliphilus serpentinus TaxID=1482731 RepID=A0A833HNG2_9FIRM|nr:Na+/H+ antiporter NhaC family protein [Alkaliphilus serpentinus]KAB3528803.1 hypothetical protein F8153_10790 [Alkaliphilus serpentinus]
MKREIKTKTSIICVVLTLIAILLGISIFKVAYYGLLFGLVLVLSVGKAHGYNLDELLSMMYRGVRKAYVLLIIMSLIGMISAAWMMGGIIPAMMKVGLSYLSNMNFPLAAFIISSGISMILGTSIGTISTVGIPLMEVARAMGLPPYLVAGAIISGAYIGDRSSPMSSSLNLTVSVTESKLMETVKHMMTTLIPAFVISIIFYYVTGDRYMVEGLGLEKIEETMRIINGSFSMGWYSFLPPLVILFMSLLKVSIVYCMATGLIASLGIIAFVYNPSFIEVAKSLFSGYYPLDPQLAQLISGGGLLSMKNVIIIIGVSTALNGLIEELSMMEAIKRWYLKGIHKVGGLIYKTSLLSFIIATITCNQSLSIIIPGRFMKDEFKKRRISGKTLARTIADTGTVLVPLIPWNVNAVAIVSLLGVSTIKYLPVAIICYVLPMITLAYGYWGLYKEDDQGLTEDSPSI